MKINKNFDWYLFTLWMILMIFGVLAIFSASTTKIGDDLLIKNNYWKQIIWIAVVLGTLYVVLKVPGPVIDIMIFPAYGLVIILLVLVLFMPAINGSHRWFMFAGMQFQPSELAKLLMILTVAKVISRPHLTEMQILIRSFSIVIVPILLILIEPDLGTTLVFWVSLFAMLIVSGIPIYYMILIVSPVFSIVTSFYIPFYLIFIATLIFVLYRFRLSWVLLALTTILNTFIFFLTPIIWNSLHDYQKGRILTFLDPTRDPLGAGYQIIQAKIAIGSGTFLGKGFLEGTQKNMNFLPEHHTDFIFSVIGEEMGFIGCAILLFIFLLFFMRIADSIKDIKVLERKFTIVGLLSYISFQMFINIAMNIGILPTTGIPLPFISYGGSNLLINSLAVSLILKYRMEKSIMDNTV